MDRLWERTHVYLQITLEVRARPVVGLACGLGRSFEVDPAPVMRTGRRARVSSLGTKRDKPALR